MNIYIVKFIALQQLFIADDYSALGANYSSKDNASF